MPPSWIDSAGPIPLVWLACTAATVTCATPPWCWGGKTRVVLPSPQATKPCKNNAIFPVPPHVSLLQRCRDQLIKYPTELRTGHLTFSLAEASATSASPSSSMHIDMHANRQCCPHANGLEDLRYRHPFKCTPPFDLLTKK